MACGLEDLSKDMVTGEVVHVLMVEVSSHGAEPFNDMESVGEVMGNRIV